METLLGQLVKVAVSEPKPSSNLVLEIRVHIVGLTHFDVIFLLEVKHITLKG
jgi:hypothetical protein